jgi:hypothetical protein
MELLAAFGDKTSWIVATPEAFAGRVDHDNVNDADRDFAGRARQDQFVQG